MSLESKNSRSTRPLRPNNLPSIARSIVNYTYFFMFTKKHLLQGSRILRSNNSNYGYKKSFLPTTLPFTINYKNVYLLRRYLGITGKILPRHTTKLTAKEHRAIAKSIRQARRIGLLPFVWLTHLSLN